MVSYKETLGAIHATNSIIAQQRYQECTDPPYEALECDGYESLRNVVDEVVRILHYSSSINNHNPPTRLLFFNGLLDLMCDHVGNEMFLNELPWNGRDDWILAKRYAWDPLHNNGKNTVPAGYVKEHKNLSFLKVLNAGHMVALDVPDVSLEMIRTFMNGKSFSLSGGSKQNMIQENPVELTNSAYCETEADGVIFVRFTAEIVVGVCLMLVMLLIRVAYVAGMRASKRQYDLIEMSEFKDQRYTDEIDSEVNLSQGKNVLT